MNSVNSHAFRKKTVQELNLENLRTVLEHFEFFGFQNMTSSFLFLAKFKERSKVFTATDF